MDYEALLKKYINHVGEYEGSTFIRLRPSSGVEFTEEEWAELDHLDNESMKLLKKQTLTTQKGEYMMTKMIEVPEGALLALKEWREDGGFLPHTYPIIDAIIACLPKPIEVGSRVRTPAGFVGSVVAVEDDTVLMRYCDNSSHATWRNGTHDTWRIETLEVIE